MRAMRSAWDDQLLCAALALDEPDEARFSEHLLAASRSVFEAPAISIFWRSAAQPHRSYGTLPVRGGAVTDAPDGLQSRLLAALHGPGAPVASAADLVRQAGLPPELLREQCGWADAMAARAVLEDLSLVLCWATPEGLLEHTERDLQHLSKVARHLEGAVRLRARVEAVAVLGPAGELLAYAGDRAPSAAALWEALLTGAVSVVPQVARLARDGARRYLLLANAPAQRIERALATREASACERLATGEQSKVVAGALQVSPSRLSRLLASAAGKLGFHTPFEALSVLGGLLALRERRGVAALSASEQEILRLVQRGLTNRDIAAARGRSERTIANQVSAVLRKTGLGSRRALAARAGRPEGT